MDTRGKEEDLEGGGEGGEPGTTNGVGGKGIVAGETGAGEGGGSTEEVKGLGETDEEKTGLVETVGRKGAGDEEDLVEARIGGFGEGVEEFEGAQIDEGAVGAVGEGRRGKLGEREGLATGTEVGQGRLETVTLDEKPAEPDEGEEEAETEEESEGEMEMPFHRGALRAMER
jgi:hypothetical protein